MYVIHNNIPNVCCIGPSVHDEGIGAYILRVKFNLIDSAVYHASNAYAEQSYCTTAVDRVI